MFGLTASTFTGLMGQPRIFYRMSVGMYVVVHRLVHAGEHVNSHLISRVCRLAGVVASSNAAQMACCSLFSAS